MESDIREAAEAVSFWLDPQNKEARRELAQRRPELEAWLSLIERKVNEKLAEVEKEEEVAMKV